LKKLITMNEIKKIVELELAVQEAGGSSSSSRGGDYDSSDPKLWPNKLKNSVYGKLRYKEWDDNYEREGSPDYIGWDGDDQEQLDYDYEQDNHNSTEPANYYVAILRQPITVNMAKGPVTAKSGFYVITPGFYGGNHILLGPFASREEAKASAMNQYNILGGEG